MAKVHITFTLNGQSVEALVEPRELLVHVVREQLQQTGSHIGCETSHCGACTMDINGESVKACTFLAVQANGADVLTVEGLAQNGELHPLQEGFMQEHGLQCGFCSGCITRCNRFFNLAQIGADTRAACLVNFGAALCLAGALFCLGRISHFLVPSPGVFVSSTRHSPAGVRKPPILA